MTFCVFIGNTRQNLFWGIIIFIRRVLPSNFVVVTFLLTSCRKGCLTSTSQTLPTLMEKIAVFMLLIFGCKILAKYQCGIDVCMMDGYIFSSIMPTFFTWERQHHTESICGRQWINTIYCCHSNLNLLFNTSGSVNEILAFIQNNCCVNVHATEMKFFTAKNVWIFHTPSSIHFTERKNYWLNAAMSGRVVYY